MMSPSKWSLEPSHAALEASDLLARIPRLLRFRLAGREDRLLLRLAQRLGFEGGASIEIRSDEPSGVHIRALRGVDEGRWQRQLEVELVSLRDLGRCPVARRLSNELEPSAARLHQGLRQSRLSVFPLGTREGGWRLLLLAGGGEHAAEILASLRDVARTILDEARRQADSGATPGPAAPHFAAADPNRRWERTRQLIETQGGMLASLAHDLKGPLAATLTALQVLHSGRAGEMSDQQGEMVDLAVRSSRRLERMIDRILLAAQEEEKELILDRRPLNGEALFERMMAAPEATAVEQHKNFAWISDPDLEIYGDADGIHRILDNLLGNALKFTPHGGSILVSARKRCILPENESLGRVAGMLGRCVDGVEILIEDSGPGMSEEARQRAFERFWQEPAERELRRGAGLGLSIVHSMVSAHQGWVRLEGGQGQGTQVRVWLPSNEADARLIASLQALETELVRRQQKGLPAHVCLLESQARDAESTASFARLLEELRAQAPTDHFVAKSHAACALVLGPELDEVLDTILEDTRASARILRRGEAEFPLHGEDLEALVEHVLGRRDGRMAAAVASGAPDVEVAR